MPFMAGTRLGFVHPPLESFASGGNVYNARLLEHAGQSGFPLVSLPWRGAAPGGNWKLLVWDSLLLDQLKRVADERIGLLLHYLPSMEPDLESGRRSKVEANEHRAVMRADFAIATGKSVANIVAARWPAKPVFVCEPGISEVFLRSRPRHEERTVKLLTVAHLLPAKGHARLLEALLALRHLQWHWHLAGDCNASSETTSLLRNRAALAGLTERITFHGALPQEGVAALMAVSDVLVCASTFEAYGMAVAEAVASGLPVLSNRVGTAEQLIRHGVTGFLTAPGDRGSFGQYLERLIEDDALRATFRHNLLRDVVVRRWEQTCADFRAVCDAMVR